jgi:hypothetical protein
MNVKPTNQNATTTVAAASTASNQQDNVDTAIKGQVSQNVNTQTSHRVLIDQNTAGESAGQQPQVIIDNSTNPPTIKQGNIKTSTVTYPASPSSSTHPQAGQVTNANACPPPTGLSSEGLAESSIRSPQEQQADSGDGQNNHAKKKSKSS